MVTYRQGDVLIIRDDNAATGTPIEREGGRVILAHGELTGHAHAIVSPAATLFHLPEDKGPEGDAVWLAADRILRASAPVVVSHEEHAPIELPAGDYRVRIQREYEPEGLRNVAD